jgi:threonine aldolase
MPPNFRSDNETPVAEAIMNAIVQANQGTAFAYAEDDWSARLDVAFSKLFERECRVLPMPTGTVANAIALAAVTPPWGSVICHRRKHAKMGEFTQRIRLANPRRGALRFPLPPVSITGKHAEMQ